LAIAVGIVQNADAMVLDEPTSGLNYAGMLSVRSLLRQLKEREKCIIVITHDHEFLTTVFDRVIEL
jgi:energy-coupling factor transport system ATP-binding protein